MHRWSWHKSCLSQANNKISSIGQDLVTMCVNDMVTCGADPLFFLDYFAASKLEPKSTAKIIKGIANACKLSDCALLDGETAEMPGHYTRENFDLAGFSVGIVEQSQLKLKLGKFCWPLSVVDLTQMVTHMRY